MDISAYLQILRRRWFALAACLVAGIAGAVGVTRSTPKAYTSTTKLFIDLPAARGVAEALQGVQLSTQLLQSYALVATSQTALGQISSRLHIAESPHVSATPLANTTIVVIKAVQSTPQNAVRVATAASGVFVDLITQYEQGKADPVVPRVIDNPTPNTTPTRPRPRRNLTIGIILGLLTGSGAAFLLEALDRSVKGPADARILVGAPVLGLVPRGRSTKANLLITDEGVDPSTSEAFRSLRTAVRFVEMATPLRSILVTSASARDGKTTVAANLAIAMADAGQRVILVDADLRRTRIASAFSIPNNPGLSSVIIHDVDVTHALQRWQNRLIILPAGPTPPNPSELLGSVGAAEVVNYLISNADVVIIDAPPVLPVTDAVVLSTLVDGVIMVVRAGQTRRDRADEARQRLEVVGANVVGCVVNSVPTSASYGGYDGYQYRDHPRRSSKSGGRHRRRPQPRSPAVREVELPSEVGGHGPS